MTLELMVVVVACLFLILVLKRKTLAAIVFGLGIVVCLAATYIQQSRAERYDQTRRIVAHQQAREAEAYARVKVADALAKEQEVRAMAQRKVAEAMAAQYEARVKAHAKVAEVMNAQADHRVRVSSRVVGNGHGQVVHVSETKTSNAPSPPAQPNAPAAPQIDTHMELAQHVIAEVTADEDFQEIAAIGQQLADAISQLASTSDVQTQIQLSVDGDVVANHLESDPARGPEVSVAAEVKRELASGPDEPADEAQSGDDEVPDWVYDSALDGYDWDGEHFRTRVLATAENREEIDALLLAEVDDALAKMAAWYRAQNGLDNAWYDRHPFPPESLSHRERNIVDRYHTETPEEIDGKMWPATYGLVDFDGQVLRSIAAHYDGVRSLSRASQATAGFAGVLALLAGVNGMLRVQSNPTSDRPRGRKRRKAAVLAATAMAIVVAIGISLLTLLPGS